MGFLLTLKKEGKKWPIQKCQGSAFLPRTGLLISAIY